jgi:hypothetical protein
VTTRLRVQVRLYDAVVEDRALVVRDMVRLGESNDAAVVFPGADLLVWRRLDGRLEVRGHLLDPDKLVGIDLGAVRVSLCAEDEESSWWLSEDGPIARLERLLPNEAPDPRLLVATAALTLLVAFLDALRGFVYEDPEVSAQVAGWFGGPIEGWTSVAPVPPVEQPPVGTEPWHSVTYQD